METASPNLWQHMRVAARRAGLSAFFRWWKGELGVLVPARLRNAMQRRRLRPVLAFETDVAVLWAPEVANSHLGYKEAARIPLAADQAAATAGRAAIGALPPAASGGGAGQPRIVVALPASQVLRKTITLPAAVEDSLEQVLAYDLDRHTPFKPDEVYFDAAVVGRDALKREIRVDWAAALRTVVDQMRRRAESWGAAVVAVTPELPDGPALLAGTALNFLPAAERPEASPWRRWEIVIPIALLAATALVATALPIWQKRGYVIALEQLTAQGRVQADASSALRAQLERLTGDYNFVLQKKYAFPSALQSVDDVTKLLPDDTWLTQLEMKGIAKGKEPHREILVRGESGNAGRLISLFEESKLFELAAPRSPTTKIQPGPGEIFDLGAQLKPLPPPQPVELAMTVAAPAAVSPAPNPSLPPATAPETVKPGTAGASRADAPGKAAAAPRAETPAQAAEAPDDAPAPASPAAKVAP